MNTADSFVSNVLKFLNNTCVRNSTTYFQRAQSASIQEISGFFVTFLRFRRIKSFCCVKRLSFVPKFRVVTWYMGSGLKAQNMTGIRAHRKRLRAQKNGIRDHKAFEPDSGIRLLHGLKISYHNIFPHNKVCVHRISYSCFRLAAVPVIQSPGCLTKTWYHILNLLLRAP